LLAIDYQEIITYSFLDESIEKALNPDVRPFALLNPISSELGVMRTSLWGGLLQTLRYNLHRQQTRARLFETGMIFAQDTAGLLQKSSIAGLVSGSLSDESWLEPQREVDFYDIRGDLEALLRLSAQAEQIIWEAGHHPALHPGQAAALKLQDQEVGRVGRLHPRLEKLLDIDQPVYLFELDLAVLDQRLLPRFLPLSKFPVVRRDLALLVDEGIRYSQIQQVLSNVDEKLLTAFHIFDVYQGPGVASGRKSIALGLILQDFSRTLDERDVEDTVSRILQRLNDKLGARLRD
jgi:phenylalanyl-tRNA synthetase beta chain